MKVKVMEVDVQRKRIALSMRMKDEPGQDNRAQRSSAPRTQNRSNQNSQGGQRRREEPQQNAAMGGAFAAAFAKAKNNPLAHLKADVLKTENLHPLGYAGFFIMCSKKTSMFGWLINF